MAKRLNLINSHLVGSFEFPVKSTALDEYRTRGKSFNQDLLRRKMFEPNTDVYTQVWEAMGQRPELFDHNQAYDLDREALKARSQLQINYLYPIMGVNYDSNKQDPSRKIAMCVAFAANDVNLSTRVIVHVVLYIETLQHLGTEKHVDLIKRAYNLKDYGCFGMTEMGHGSNVAKVETEAIYDTETRTFVLNSPTATASK